MDTENTSTIMIHLDDEIPHCIVYWDNNEIKVAKMLSLPQMLGFVDGVVSSCFDNDTGEYKPEIKDFVVRCAIINLYTNVSLPECVEDIYRLVYETDIIQSIMPSIMHEQYNAIIAAIDQKIENIAQCNVQALTKRMDDIVSQFSEMEKDFARVFDGVDDKMISDMATTITNSGVTEESLLKFATEQAKKEKVIPISKELNTDGKS